MNAIERALNYDKRLAGQLAAWAIKKNLVRALVELITNSDDSYKRLADRGTPKSGLIKVRVNKKNKGASTIQVIDEAEGFDYDTMDDRVGTYAADTSGFTEGMSVRGYFGRGLKDAILGMGEGRIQSLKEKYYYECSLDQEKFVLENPKHLSKKELKAVESELGIRSYSNGSKVTIYITKPGVSISHFDNLVEQLENYYSLRDINYSDKRVVKVVQMNDAGVENRSCHELKYKFPLGEFVLEKEIIIPYNSLSIPAHLFVNKSKEPLDQNGPCREGGILICGKNTIHDITLFSFDNDPYASRLFGRLKCKYIDDLLKNQEPIISDERDGLDWKNHEFAVALKRVVEKELKPIVKAIKEEEEKKRKTIENEKTRQRHIAAVKRLNQIANRELGGSFEKGVTNGSDHPSVALPPNGFDFVPDFYKILAGRRSTLSLKLTVPWIIADGTTVKIGSENEDIEIVENRSITVDKNLADKNDIVTVNPKIVGRGVGIDSIITATAGEMKAEAYVEVVSKREKKTTKKKDREDRKGLFSDIKFDSTLDPRIRHYFNRDTGEISISSRAPSVSKYLGPNGEGQDEIHCQVLMAELVTDSVCRELARLKADKGKLQVLGDDITGAINKEINQLVYSYAHVIHDVLLDKPPINSH
jgi:hypothetical protein